MRELKIQTLKFLGRGSMFNATEGSNSAYWKDDSKKHMLLIDCGPTIFRRILELDILDGVKELVILITHCHSDHIGSLSDLIHFCIFCKPEIKVTIASSPQVFEPIKRYLDLTGTTFCINKAKNVKAKPMPLGGEFACEDVGLLCDIKFIVDKTHKVPTATGVGIPSCGIMIKFLNKTIYYSGDTQRIPYEELDMSSIDELYLDCAVRTKSTGSDDKYPHYTIYDIHKDLEVCHYPLDQVFLMHIDCEGVKFEAERFGIKVVELE